MLKILKTKFFKFAVFAASSQGLTQVKPMVVYRNDPVDVYGRFGKHHRAGKRH